MQSKINISIDDVSPHPKSSVAVLDRCHELIEEFPNIKFTLFIPIAYWRTMKNSIATEKPLLITESSSFCEELKELPENNFELAYHGYYHGIPGRSDNDELRDLNYEEAVFLYKKMFDEVARTDLKFKNILRPPAWRMSPEAIRAAKDVGFEILALSPEKYPDGSLDYKGEDKKFGNVVYYNACPPYKPLKVYDKTEVVYHACEWDKNYLDEKKTKKLSEFIKNNDVKFCFMKEMI
jgi:predicted deacetylase